jgi:hypothetical protein
LKIYGHTKAKNEEKGPTKFKMKGINPQKNFCFTNILKMSRAYENLNPDLSKVAAFVGKWLLFKGTLIERGPN